MANSTVQPFLFSDYHICMKISLDENKLIKILTTGWVFIPQLYSITNDLSSFLANIHKWYSASSYLCFVLVPADLDVRIKAVTLGALFLIVSISNKVFFDFTECSLSSLQSEDESLELDTPYNCWLSFHNEDLTGTTDHKHVWCHRTG